jgi:hypothetical protein
MAQITKLMKKIEPLSKPHNVKKLGIRSSKVHGNTNFNTSKLAIGV